MIWTVIIWPGYQQRSSSLEPILRITGILQSEWLCTLWQNLIFSLIHGVEVFCSCRYFLARTFQIIFICNSLCSERRETWLEEHGNDCKDLCERVGGGAAGVWSRWVVLTVDCSHTWRTCNSGSLGSPLVELLTHPPLQSQSITDFTLAGADPLGAVTERNLLPTRAGRALRDILLPSPLTTVSHSPHSGAALTTDSQLGGPGYVKWAVRRPLYYAGLEELVERRHSGPGPSQRYASHLTLQS